MKLVHILHPKKKSDIFLRLLVPESANPVVVRDDVEREWDDIKDLNDPETSISLLKTTLRLGYDYTTLESPDKVSLIGD